MTKDLFTVKVCDLVAVVLLGVILAPWESAGLGWLPAIGGEVTAVAYVYESEDGSVPPYVTEAMRTLGETLEARISKDGFYAKKTVWLTQGFTACRHGVFFQVRSLQKCPCLARDPAWHKTMCMPSLTLLVHFAAFFNDFFEFDLPLCSYAWWFYKS